MKQWTSGQILAGAFAVVIVIALLSILATGLKKNAEHSERAREDAQKKIEQVQVPTTPAEAKTALEQEMDGATKEVDQEMQMEEKLLKEETQDVNNVTQSYE